MKTVNICDLPINIHDGVLGISHSGGADSGLLLYILMKHYDGPLHVYTCSSKQKNRVSPHVALNVIDKCMDLTGKKEVFHHTYHVEIQTFETLFDPLKIELEKNNIDYMYTGVTNNPPDSVLVSFKNNNNGLGHKRNPNIIKNPYIGRFYTPFTNIDKKNIANMYNDLGILDTIFPITRSCENQNLLSGHCGECWWCEERYWAFNRLS